MPITKLNPWNWFKKEHEQEKSLPVRQAPRGGQVSPTPLDLFHTEFDRMVESMFSGFGMPSPRSFFDGHDTLLEHASIKPKVDVYGTDKEYVIEVDLPGLDEKDLSIDLKDDMLILSAEKKHEEKVEDKGYYRMERSYGSFRRVLNIPDDADAEKISAKLNKGVLCITMPRTKNIESSSRKVAIESTPSA